MNIKLKNIILKNNKTLENSPMDFEALYNITFQNTGIMAEDNDGFRIRTYTYEDIRNRIEEMSCAIYKKIGATHSYVAVEMENSVEWIVTFWSILRSGNKPYLVNCRHPEALANSALKTLNIKYILGTNASRLNGEFTDISTLKTEERFDGVFENEIALSTSATSLKEVICFYTGAQLSAQILNVKTFINKYPEITKTYKGSIKNLAFFTFLSHIRINCSVFLVYIFRSDNCFYEKLFCRHHFKNLQKA